MRLDKKIALVTGGGTGIEQVAGVVYEDVETAKRSDRGLHRASYIRIVCHTSLKRQCMAATLGDVFDDSP